MSLRRKPAFRRTGEAGSAKTSLYAYPDRDLEKDYIIWHSVNGAKVGQRRKENTRQLVTIQEVKSLSVTQFSRLSRILHENIASPISLYRSHVVYEYVDLDVLDILPLTQPEIADVMTQATAAVHAALKESLTFRISAIRISYLGVIKLILDWNFEVSIDKAIVKANLTYLALYFAEMMDFMGRFLTEWDQNALDFKRVIHSGRLPGLEHPFLLKRKRGSTLHKPTLFAMRKELHASKLNGCGKSDGEKGATASGPALFGSTS